MRYDKPPKVVPFCVFLALLSVYLPDLFVDGIPEVCVRFRRFSSMRSKAPLKKIKIQRLARDQAFQFSDPPLLPLLFFSSI